MGYTRPVLLVSLLLLFGLVTTQGLLTPQENEFSALKRDTNGGTDCAVCSVLLGLVDQLAEIYNETIADSMSRLCSYLPKGYTEGCKFLIDEFGPSVIALFEKKETPDTVCYAIGLCKHDTATMCHLFPLPTNAFSSSFKDTHQGVDALVNLATTARGRSFFSLAKLCSISIFKPICQLIDKFANNHEPIDDSDGDGFSTLHTFRGAYWRGKDCNDVDKQIYPGRATSDDALKDTNCNGIIGIDPSTKKTYEEQWCSGTQAMGTALLGDSAGAHFHLPPSWLTPKEINGDTYSNLPMIAENEFDWPMLSFMTGYASASTWAKDIQGPTQSIYLKMRDLNRCNHRDYQNIGVNGARASSMKDSIMKSFARHKNFDKPVLVMIELIGNDVCNSHHSLDHMTKPADYSKSMAAIFEYLDSILPNGSIILGTGLAKGTILYDILKDRIHPIGSTRGDVTYSNLYDYLNCLEISPCFGWMNTNETWRNLTDQRAQELTDALITLINNTKYTNISVVYAPQPIQQIFDMWKGDPADLIEPVDGFHPSQQSNALIANVTWSNLQKNYPHLLPPINPHNDLIEKQFGDQGGY